MLDTDQSAVYTGVMPAAQHQAISGFARHTNRLERCNHTWRPRVCRLVREAWSCAKKLADHLGAIQRFMCHDHLTNAPA
jgi:insertion element IS1 protein InsB